MADTRAKVVTELQRLTKHQFVELVERGNAAITTALSILPKGTRVLIPAEGGWVHYKKGPEKLGLAYEEVLCHDAKIDLDDLREKVEKGDYAAFLYQNPGGYFAEQPMKEIFDICKMNDCLVILDVSGSIGTEFCDGRYADILVGSFGEGKLVEAKGGGVISCNDQALWKRLEENGEPFDNPQQITVILKKLEELPERILFLWKKRKQIIGDLSDFSIVHPLDRGFVVVVAFSTLEEKERIINYCEMNHLPYTWCPRYIRLQRKAISIEVKKCL